MWVFDVSHGLLLFRKRATNIGEKSVDIVFKDVRSIQVCDFLDSIRIEEVNSIDIVGKALTSEKTEEPGLRWFRITSKEGEGYICASGYKFHEDAAEFGEPSAIYEPGPLLVNLAVNSSWYREKYAPAILKRDQ